jgi:hypothetical protein
MPEPWLKCSACRQDIAFSATHWVCSVSTCNRHRTRLVFCSVACWDSHVAMLRHRDAWAVEAKAPTQDAWARELAADAAAVAVRVDREQKSGPIAIPPRAPGAATTPTAAVTRRVVDAPPMAGAGVGVGVALQDAEHEMLIVVSKLKKYIKDRSGFNCGETVADVLSDHVRAICDDAIRAAGRDERKTVLERDVPRPRR